MAVQRAPRRPATGDYAEFYAGYVEYVPDGEIVEILEGQSQSTSMFLLDVSETRHDFRYRPEKWSAKEVLGHINDTERIFSYRALCFARGDATHLPGMDQDQYVNGADFSARSWESLVEEFVHLRISNCRLFESSDDATLERRGVASECEFTVRALLYIMAGHVAHHVRVLEERYL